MSVDCRAKIVRGWIIDNEIRTKLLKHNEELEDNIYPINCYDEDSPYVFGVEDAVCCEGEYTPIPVDKEVGVSFLQEWMPVAEACGVGISQLGLPDTYLVCAIT